MPKPDDCMPEHTIELALLAKQASKGFHAAMKLVEDEASGLQKEPSDG